MAPRTPNQLPSGKHGLPRGYVLRNQRERILDAVVNVVAERGYAEMAVDDIIAYAGVSRRTFYERFANKEHAFLAAYDLVVEQLLGAVRTQFMKGATWRERIRLGLHAFLRSIADEPKLAHVCMVEVFPAGPIALRRRTEAMDAFRELLVPAESEWTAGLVPRRSPPRRSSAASTRWSPIACIAGTRARCRRCCRISCTRSCCRSRAARRQRPSTGPRDV